MIDLHTHILPNLDDGCSNFPTALKLIKKEIEDGVRKIVFTPNIIQGLYKPTKGEIENTHLKIKQALSELNWKIETFIGSELRLTPNILEDNLITEFITLNNTSYLLIDIYNIHLQSVTSVIEKLISSGFHLIIAHPEQYQDVQDNIFVLEHFTSLGCLIQVSTKNLLGMRGKRNQKVAEKIIKNNFANVLATDCHDPFSDYASLKNGYEAVKKMTNEPLATLLVEKNCDMILQGKSLWN